ncbi:chemotaxis protein CheW [Sphingomonas solaris]|uniref:Chemotaxis protein CheW n=2 Tax=Alterirhizorhabdus solaris TaxID=2529389 RepID=A0A558QX15_9SPHN|nr:chemotaxis protein CheW [Sphingomonas solaris]
MTALHLIVRIAGQQVALPAGPVDSVIRIDTISPVPCVPSHIAGLVALRSRVLTIVDCLDSLGLGRSLRTGVQCAVAVTIDGHRYGLLVDAVLDVVTIAEAPRPVDLALSPGWARAACGLVEHDGAALLLLDPAALVAGPAAA